MNLLPKKHIRFYNSIIGFAPKIFNEWNDEKNINDNIELIQKKYKKDINDIIICIDYLYCIGKLRLENEGVIKKC